MQDTLVKSGPVSKWIEMVAITGLVLVCILLVFQNRNLKTRVASLTSLLYEQAQPAQLKPGDYVMELEFRTLDGNKAKRSFLRNAEMGNGRAVVLVLLSPDCGYCESEVPFWSRLADRAEPREEFIAVSLGGAEATKQFMVKNSVPFPVFLGGANLRNQLHAPGVPFLVRLSAKGRVEEVSAGFRNAQDHS